MIAALAWRPAAPGRREQARSRNITWEHRRSGRAGTPPLHRGRAPATPRASASRPRRAPAPARLHLFEASARLFVLSAGVLTVAFLTALLYLRFTTGIAAGGYDLRAFEARRDDLRRESELLRLQLGRLDAPARIEAEARRLGLQKAARPLYITTGSTVSTR